MARRQAFVYRHPMLTVLIIGAVELAVIGLLHVVLGWSLLAVVMAGLGALLVATLLMG